MQTGAIRVYPPAVEFRGVEPGTLYCIVICIQNASQFSRRIRLEQPANASFRVNFSPGGRVAPGIDVRAEVEFKADAARDQSDTLVIMSEGDRVEVPLRAFAPAPQVEFDGFANLGVVVADNRASKVVEFKNLGHKRCDVAIELQNSAGASLPVTITPSSFSLAPRGAFLDLDNDGRMEQDEFVEGARGVWKQSVTVELEPAAEPGPFRALAKVMFSGQPDRMLDITATVVEQRLELVLPDGGGQMSELHFGTLFYGQQREVTALLVNNGPNPAHFSTSIEDAKAGDTNAAGSDSDDEAFNPIHVLPLDGTIEPYGQVPVRFSFRPEDTSKPPRFRSQVDPKSVVKEEKYEMQAIMECPQTKQQIFVDVTATASKPQLELDRRSFKFGDCPVNERRDILFKIKNPNTELPVEWSIAKVANFRTAPTHGRLQPLQSQNVVLSFVPSQLGRFNTTLHLVMSKGILTLPLRVAGTASSTAPAARFTRHGKDAAPSTFKPKYVYPTSPTSLSPLPHTAALLFQPPRYTFVGPKDVKTSTAVATSKKFVRPAPWEELTKAGDIDLTQPSEVLYTFSVQDMVARADHRQQYAAVAPPQHSTLRKSLTQHDHLQIQPVPSQLAQGPRTP